MRAMESTWTGRGINEFVSESVVKGNKDTVKCRDMTQVPWGQGGLNMALGIC